MCLCGEVRGSLLQGHGSSPSSPLPSRKQRATYTSSDSSEIYRLSAQAKKLIRSVTKELPDEEVAKDHFNIYLCDVPMLLGCIDMKLLIGGKADLEDVAGFQPRVVV